MPDTKEKKSHLPERLRNMLAVMVGCLTGDEPDLQKAAATIKDIMDWGQSDDAKGYAATDGLNSQMAQMKKDLDANIEEVRRIRKAGLTINSGRLIIPQGREARLEMMRDQRAFLSDESAMRFGGWFYDRTCQILGRKTPPAVKEISDAVDRDWDPGTGASGAYAIPDEFLFEIIRNVEAKGTLFPLCRRVILTTIGSTYLLKGTAGLAGYWVKAATQIPGSTPTFDLATLTPEKLGVFTVIPNEFNRTALLIEIGNYVAVELVDAIVDKIDEALVNGDGTASYGEITGILQSANIAAVTAAAGHTTLATITATDIGNVPAGIGKSYAIKNARWGLSLSVLMKMRNIRSAVNELPIVERGSFGTQVPANVDGYPFALGTQMPAAAAITAGVKYAFFGDLNKSHAVGMLRGIEIARSDQYAFPLDVAAVRAILHVDITEIDANAIVTAKTAAE